MQVVSVVSHFVVVVGIVAIFMRPERAAAAPPLPIDASGGEHHQNKHNIDGLIRDSLEDLSTKISNHRQTTHERQSADGIPRRQRRPFVTLAYAQSIDGKIALAWDPTDAAAPHETSNVDDSIANESPPQQHGTTTNGRTTTTTTITSSNFAISGPESLKLTHALRSIHDAILVGGNTLSIDNPRLSNRLWPPTPDNHRGSSDDDDDNSNNNNDSEVVVDRKQPVPVVLDTHLRHVRALGNTMKARHPIVCCSTEAYHRAREEGYVQRSPSSDDRTTQQQQQQQPSRESDTGAGGIPSSVTLLPCKTRPVVDDEDDETRVVLDLPDVLRQLHEEMGIESLMVEGGATVLSMFVEESRREDDDNDNDADDADLFDCLCVTISPKLLGANGLDSLSSSNRKKHRTGGEQAAAAVLGPLRCITLGDDIVLFADRR